MLLENDYKNSPVAVATKNYKKATRTGEENFRFSKSGTWYELNKFDWTTRLRDFRDVVWSLQSSKMERFATIVNDF